MLDKVIHYNMGLKQLSVKQLTSQRVLMLLV